MLVENFKHAHVQMKMWNRSLDLFLYNRNSEGHITFIDEVTLRTEKDAYKIIEPKDPIILPLETAQELMDGLWQCGLRPSEGSGSAGALRATENHLKDMQELSKRLLSMVEKHERGA
jgi:hypothetical protein